MTNAHPSPKASAGRSVYAHLLVFSGFLGIAAGLGLELYRLTLIDHVLGTGVAPYWVASARFTLLAGSLVVLLYGLVLDDLFKGWLDIVVISALIGQWGLPLSIYLDTTNGGLPSLYGFFGLACAGLFVSVGFATALNYGRRKWPFPILMERLK